MGADQELREAARALLRARVAAATGADRPADESRAWDRFALALDAAEDAAPPLADVRTETRTQFWRESEQRWVDHVNIRTWGVDKDEPQLWRHRRITTTTVVGDWQDGRR